MGMLFYSRAIWVLQNKVWVFKIYPSPAFEEINLETNSHEKSYVTICDGSGTIVYQASIKANEPINVSAWNAGAYIVKIVENGNIFIDEFIKE